MFRGVTGQEMSLLNAYNLLQEEGKQEVQDYLCYTLFKQYKRELYQSVLGSQALYHGFLQVTRMCERDDVSMEDILARVKQIKYAFYQRYEKVYIKYTDVLTDLHVEDTLHQLARIGFEHILEAIHSNRKNLVKSEVEEFLEIMREFANNREKRRIVAVGC